MYGVFSCFLIKPAYFPHMSLLTSHLISGRVLRVEQETIISLSTSFPFHFWSCRVPFQIKTIRKINVNWCLKPWISWPAVLYTYFSFYILLCLSVSVCVHRLVCMHPHVSIHQCLSIKQIYCPGNKDCHNPVFVSPKWKWLLGSSILWSKNLRTLHFEMMPNAVRTAQVFSHVKRIYWLCLTDSGKAQAVPVLT